MTDRPLALDLCSGLGGWAEGLEAEGWDVIRVDVVDMFAELGKPKPPNCLLMLQDILTFHGAQAKRCALIVASPPCQEFSWMAMPWSRAKQVGRALRGEDEFPSNYRGSRTVEQLTALFNACFRIQREASEAAGHPIPMVVENVKGAEPWVGRSRWAYGSYHLWGDVPALMPSPSARRMKYPVSAAPRMWRDRELVRLNDPMAGAMHARLDRSEVAEGRKGVGAGAARFDANLCQLPSKSPRRKEASALIAKIPEPLSRHIARTLKPRAVSSLPDHALVEGLAPKETP